MARVTVEDCLHNVDNRFQLVLVAAKRARQLTMGKEPMVAWENDKATVVALREISAGLVDRTILEKVVEEEKKEETLEELLAAADESEGMPLVIQESPASEAPTSGPINNNELSDTGMSSPVPEFSVSMPTPSSEQLSAETMPETTPETTLETTTTTDENISSTPEVDPDNRSDGTPTV